MYELKTKINDQPVEAFLNKVEDPQKQQDSFAILDMMAEITGQPPRMWGDSLVGFGKYQYKYASGHQGEWFLVGFSPRKQNLTLYFMSGFDEYDGLVAKLGKYKTGKSCLYIKKLEDVNQGVLRELIELSIKLMRASSA
ncbi:hypothetical protein ADN00_02730 [Ornatilinea apprima]|uniref:YdhG-like domain-containing protein n=1 Tax=Ornatilinea apprima TaxID=1134406 RepID=A0A0P6YBQ9_9CHLR|nr:DUF1801 domain-containing protein [Ornatilinea apprima]KPL79372.1 hypothetical protein ADN00_02730 [Ornatilinea apprima]